MNLESIRNQLVAFDLSAAGPLSYGLAAGLVIVGALLILAGWCWSAHPHLRSRIVLTLVANFLPFALLTAGDYLFPGTAARTLSGSMQTGAYLCLGLYHLGVFLTLIGSLLEREADVAPAEYVRPRRIQTLYNI